MSNSEKYTLEMLNSMPWREIQKIAKKKMINATRNKAVLINEILNPNLRTLIKQKKTQKKIPQSSRSSSQKKSSKSSSKSRKFKNLSLVRSVISSIIMDNSKYTFLYQLDFNYGKIAELLNINYKDDPTVSLKKVKDYLTENNILNIAKELEMLNTDVEHLRTIIHSKQNITMIDDDCDNINTSISRIKNDMQSNSFITIKEEYKKKINGYIDGFNKKSIITNNSLNRDLTIRNRL